MADVFVSYAREDQARAAQIARGLEAEGYDVFWDNEIPPGQTWADYIEAKLADAKALVVLWSGASTQSQWVREEARMGRDRGKLVPVLLDGAPAPFGFGELQAADLSAWTGAAADPAWRRFVAGVNAKAGAPARPSAPHAAPSPPEGGATGAAEALSPIGYIRKCLRLYFDAKGRARRAEYWWWTLFVIGVSLGAAVIDIALFGTNTFTGQPNLQLVSGLAGLALAAPGLCVTIRRFHDVGLSGWLPLAGVVAMLAGVMASAASPPLGALIVLGVALAMFIVTVIPSRPGPNRYGPNPKGA